MIGCKEENNNHALWNSWNSIILDSRNTVLPGLAGGAAPSNYDECILESMKGVKSDLAAKSIIMSCRNKFSDKEHKDFKTLSDKEMSQLTGRAGFSESYFSGRIHSGNANVTISKITIQITTAIGGKKVTKLYRDDVTIEPQTTKFFMFEALRGDKDADYSWAINSVIGY